MNRGRKTYTGKGGGENQLKTLAQGNQFFV